MTSLDRARDDQRGFTLTELLVAMAIVALIMAGLMTLLKKGNETYLAGANQVEAQAAVRAALERMTQEIREAGYNPTGLPSCTVGPPPPCLDPIINQTPTSFTIQNDWDGNGAINNAISVCMTYSWAACPNPGGPNNRGELITYSVAGGNLTRLETGPQGGGLQVLVQNVVQANVGGVLQPFFQYLDQSGGPPAVPIPANLRTVVVNFQVGVQGQTPGSWQTGAVQVAMSDRIRLRNR